MIIEAPILAHYKYDLKTIVDTDYSDYMSNRVIFQLGKNRLLYSVVFFSKNLNRAKYNSKIYDKKLLAII